MTMDQDHANETVIETAEKLGTDDAISLMVVSDETMARFANDSITVTKRISDASLLVYLAKNKRRIVGASSNPDDASVKLFVRRLYDSLLTLPEEPDFARIPTSARSYGNRGRQDKKIATIDEGVPDYAARAIEAARSAGAKRTAGAVESSHAVLRLLTSSGTTGADEGSKLLLNVRAFGEKEASGHGLSCSATLGGFDPEEAGRRAGEHAKKMRNAKRPEEGTYQILMSPTVAANLVSLIGDFASAFAVDAGVSYLAGKLNKRVASRGFALSDHGQLGGALDSRSFDDEGLPTQTTPIIEDGTLRNYLHNLTTAKKFGARSTGNAGWIEPQPWNLEVGAGDASYEEMLSQVRHGIVLTSNWYTRFTNYRTGEFSTVPRDGAYLVENGRVTTPVSGLRISDTLERMFSSVESVSKKREWIQWWEVDVPTLCPWLLVGGVRVTRAYG